MRPRPSAPLTAARPLAILAALLCALALLQSQPEPAAAYQAAKINSTADIPVGLKKGWEDADALLRNDRAAAIAGYLEVYAQVPTSQELSRVRIATYIGVLLTQDWQFPRAYDLLDSAVEVATEEGFAEPLAIAEVAMGRLQFLVGDEGAALDRLALAHDRIAQVEYRDFKAHIEHEYARALIEVGKLNEALALLGTAREEHIKELKRQGDELKREELYAENSALVGRLLERHGSASRATQYFERGVTDVPQRAIYDAIRADAYVELGKFQWRQFNVGKARDVLGKALTLYGKANVDDVRGAANVRSILGDIAFELGGTAEAIEQYTDALADVGDAAPFWTATLRAARARARISIGGLKAAEADLEAATTALDDNPAPRLQASILRYQGALAQARGQYQDALDARAQAVEIAKAAEDFHSIGDSLFDLGETYLAIGNADRAEAAYSEAVANARKTDSKRMIARAWTSLATAQLQTGTHSGRMRAFDSLVEATKAAKDIGDGVLSATIELTEGNVFTAVGQPGRALEQYDAALEFVGSKDLRLRIAILLAKGGAHLELSDENAAKAPLTEANTLAQRLHDQGLIADCQAQLGRYEAARGNNSRAFDYFEQAAVTIEASRATLAGSANKTALVAQNQLVFSNLVDLAARNDPSTARDAFAWAEKAKARTFLDQLAEAQQNIRVGIDPALRDEEQERIRAIGQLRNTIAHLQSTGAADDAIKPYTDDLTQEERAFAALQERIAARNPRYADLRYPKPADVATVQRTLASGEVMLAYYVGPDQSHGWAITKTAIKHATLPGENDLRRLVGYHRDLIVTGSPLAIAEFGRSATTLGRHLLAPFASMLPRDASVIVAPDGPLHYLPIETLFLDAPAEPVETYDAMPYFVKHAGRLRYVQSATVLVSLNNTPASQGAGNYLVALGDPIFEDERRPQQGISARSIITRDLFARLPYTAGEVNALGDLARRAAPTGQPIKIYTRDDATEEALKDLATNARYVHVATHGVLDERNPSFSGVVLTAQEQANARDDGYCYLVEIFNLQFKADLIVLSACETGLGRLVGGEGVEGLTRAFMYAGAPRSLVTLWSVDDESTADLMRDFYRNLWTDGQDPARALITAKRAMLARDGGRFAAPFFWSPFVMVGKK